jgi:hypothetical protein
MAQVAEINDVVSEIAAGAEERRRSRRQDCKKSILQ